MIIITDKQKCCGCSACEEVCPRKCISMLPDSEGFQYPSVDAGKCIGCGLCERVCPVLKSSCDQNVSSRSEGSKEEITQRIVLESKDKPKSCVGFIKNDGVRNDSTSGGVFSALAYHIIALGGVVIGARFNGKFEVEHWIAESKSEIGQFRGSKYVQSKQDGIYLEVKKLLDEGRWVLYSGTPCQAAGLRTYLHSKEYEKLIIVDIFCHGVGSPLYWQEYLKYVSKAHKKSIKRIKFREKTYGYNSACLAIYFSDGSSIKKGHDEDHYWAAFSKSMIFRPICYACPFKTLKHEYSDFSIGDFWDTTGLTQEYKDANGCSLVLIQSVKGMSLLREIKTSISFSDIDLQNALLINGGWQPSKLITSSERPSERNTIFEDLICLGFVSTANKYTPVSTKTRVKAILKPVLYKTGLLEKLKKIY